MSYPSVVCRSLAFPRLPASESIFLPLGYLHLNDRLMPSVDFSGVIQGVQSFFPVVFLVKPAPGRGVFCLHLGELCVV